MNVDAGVDYRLRTLTQAHLWLSPLNAETTRRWINSGWRWRGQNETPRNWRLTIAAAHAGVENQTLAVSFTTLCVDARSQHDYIALSRLFHTVMVLDVCR
jgi:cell division protein ZapE